MSRRVVAEAVVWVLTLFFTVQMFAAPVRELVRRLAAPGDSASPQ